MSVELPINDPKAMDVMNDYYASVNNEIEQLSKNLGISLNCAADVWYLRTRSRHTHELEVELI